jgi:hypothetical protein
VLYHDRHVGFDDAGKIGSRWNFFRISQIVKPHVLCPARGHCNRVGAGRFAIREEDGNQDVSILIRGIEQADGLMAGEFRLGTVAPAGNIALRDCPKPRSDCLHVSLLKQRKTQRACQYDLRFVFTKGFVPGSEFTLSGASSVRRQSSCVTRD